MGSTAKILVYNGSRENKIVLFCLSFSGSVPLKIVNMFKVCLMPNIDAGFTKLDDTSSQWTIVDCRIHIVTLLLQQN